MIGDRNDILQRLRLTLPARWFADVAPNLDGLLFGIGAIWAGLYQLLKIVIDQSRVQSASASFLDLAARDFLRDSLRRRNTETDAVYRERLLAAMQREGATRPAIIAAASAAGYSLDIFESAQPSSTGALNVAAGLSWSTAGAWGSMEMPLECLLIAHPLAAAYEDELWRNLALATPAGGVLWLHVASTS